MTEDKKTIQPSLFSFLEKRELKVSFEREKEDGAVSWQGIETAIIRLLAKYRLLNRFNIERELKLLLPVKLHKPNYMKEIKSLEKEGSILRYAYTDDTENGRDNLVLYGLTRVGCRRAAQKGIALGYEETKEGIRLTTPAALELASLNQWHIGIRCGYQDLIQNEYYQEMSYIGQDKGVLLPSIFKMSADGFAVAHECALAAVPYPKKKDALGVMLNLLLGINAFVKERSMGYPVYIVVVDGLDMMEEAYRRIYRYRVLQELHIYFVMDIYTTEIDQLQWIYRCFVNDKNEVRYEPVRLWEEYRNE